MKIKTVAVLGAGAVGSYIIWGLADRKDVTTGVIAEGERAERLKKGCTINHVTYHPQVWTPKEAHGVDLLIVSLKYGALPSAMESIREAVGENTIVMSLMNGVDSEEFIEKETGSKNILYSLIKVASHHEADGCCFDPETTIGIVSAKRKRLLTAKMYLQWKSFSRVRISASAAPNISERRYGANSG